MPKKAPPKPRKNTDPEEYKRFLETAKKVGASDDPKDFDRALTIVLGEPQSELRPPKRKGRSKRR